MQCPNCHTENPETRKFCKECGTKLSLICPDCRFENAYGDKFCGECGTNLIHQKKEPKSKTTQPSQVDYSTPKSYTPKHLAEKILTTRSAIEGERKIVTVMFTDVAGFTSFSEKLDPEDVHGIMDGCFKILMDEIHRCEGTINQFTGDGVMALFGAPLAHEDHAVRACHAALSIQERMAEYRKGITRTYGIDFKMRIGLNSGPVVVGSIGDDLRMDYTAQGDTSNLAARMENCAEPGSICVTDQIYRITKEFFEFESLGPIQVKGKEKPVEAYRLIKPTEVKTRIAASKMKGLTRFLGREREMETLTRAFAKVKAGEGQVVGIVGEAGVGKSRLLLEFRNFLPTNGHLYFEGRCLHYGGAIPYLPVLDVLRSFLDIREGEEESIVRKKLNSRIIALDENLKDSICPMQELLSLKVDDENYSKLEPKQKKEKTFEAIRNLLIRGSQIQPIILTLEDIHWIDKTTEEFIDYMIGWLPRTRILLLLLYRPEYTHQWGSKSYYRLISVQQLPAEVSTELIGAILNGDVVPELRKLILSRSSGNPLFMEEMTHNLLDSGTIRKKDDRYILSADVASFQVPDTIQGIIAARLDRLEGSLKRIMQVAAVVGREFAFRILESILEMKEGLKSNLINLQGLEFIYEKSLFPELEYIFKHALVQEVAYNSLLISRRKEIHEKIGRAIETLYPHRLEEFYEILAYHFAKGEEFDKASRYLKLSGSKAAQRQSTLEAYNFYKQALHFLSRLPETDENKKEKVEVLVLITTPMQLLGFPEGSLEMLQEGEMLCNVLGDYQRLPFFYGTLSLYYTYSGYPLLGVKYSENALDLGLKSENLDLSVSVGHGLSISYLARGQFDKMVNISRNILELIDKKEKQFEYIIAHRNSYAWFSSYCGIGMGTMGNFVEGCLILDKSLLHASRNGNIRGLALVESFYGTICYLKGDWKVAAEHLQKSIQYSEDVKFIFLLCWNYAMLGNVYTYLGDPEAGKTYGQKGIKIQLDAGIEFTLGWLYTLLAITHLELGDLDQAQIKAEEGLRLSQKNNEKYFEAVAWIFLGRVLGHTNNPQIQKAEDYILKGMNICDNLKTKPSYGIGHLFLGELYAKLGRKQEAIKNLKKVESLFREMGMEYWLGKSHEALSKIG